MNPRTQQTFTLKNPKQIKQDTKNQLEGYSNMIENLKNIDSLIYTGLEIAGPSIAPFTGIAGEPLKAVSETKKFMNIFKKKIDKEEQIAEK